MSDGYVTEEVLRESIRDFECAQWLLSLADGRNEGIPDHTLEILLKEGKKQDGQPEKFSSGEAISWWEVAHWMEDKEGRCRPWLVLLERAWEYWNYFPREEEGSLQEGLLRVVGGSEDIEISHTLEQARDSAWQCLVRQLEREFPSQTALGAGIRVRDAIPSPDDLFGPPSLEQTLKEQRIHGNNPKGMHLPTVVMAMLWTCPRIPLWLASVPVVAEIVWPYLRIRDFQFDQRSGEDDPLKGFARVCGEHINRDGLLRGKGKSALICGVETSPDEKGVELFMGYRFHGDIDPMEIGVDRYHEPPDFNEGQRLVRFLDLASKIQQGSPEEMVSRAMKAIQLHPKLESIRQLSREPEAGQGPK